MIKLKSDSWATTHLKTETSPNRPYILDFIAETETAKGLKEGKGTNSEGLHIRLEQKTELSQARGKRN